MVCLYLVLLHFRDRKGNGSILIKIYTSCGKNERMPSAHCASLRQTRAHRQIMALNFEPLSETVYLLKLCLQCWLYSIKEKIVSIWAHIKCIAARTRTALSITHDDDQMLCRCNNSLDRGPQIVQNFS